MPRRSAPPDPSPAVDPELARSMRLIVWQRWLEIAEAQLRREHAATLAVPPIVPEPRAGDSA